MCDILKTSFAYFRSIFKNLLGKLIKLFYFVSLQFKLWLVRMHDIDVMHSIESSDAKRS